MNFDNWIEEKPSLSIVNHQFYTLKPSKRMINVQMNSHLNMQIAYSPNSRFVISVRGREHSRFTEGAGENTEGARGRSNKHGSRLLVLQRSQLATTRLAVIARVNDIRQHLCMAPPPTTCHTRENKNVDTIANKAIEQTN